ncbi:MAG: lipopolysaccharide heptosyltransferase II, partial [Candidatus Eisenbacteria bacterium]
MPTGHAQLTRYLVRLPNWLGDALMARPLLLSLRTAFPLAEVIAVGPASLLDLLAGDGLWDSALALSDVRLARKKLRAQRVDAAIICPPSFSSAWLAWQIGAAIRAGFRGELRDAMLTHPVARPQRGEMHLSREYLTLGEAIGARGAGTLEPLPVSGPSVIAARQLSGDFPYAIIGPGAVYGPAKRWPVERYAEVARQLVERGVRVLACGAQAERSICEEVAGRAGGGVVSLAGRTDLGVQAALCAGARVTVCNDSGLAHLAAATGAPTVSVFGSTSSAWTAPL